MTMRAYIAGIVNGFFRGLGIGAALAVVWAAILYFLNSGVK